MSFVTIYMTAGNEDEAAKIASRLVHEKLVACANIIPRIRSIYEWGGVVEDEAEAAAIFKTQEKRIKEVITRICELHSYATPCITVWDIRDGHRPYLEWVADQTLSAGSFG